MSRVSLGQGSACAHHRWSALDRRERRYLRTAWTDRAAFPSGIVIPIAHGRSGSALFAVGLAVGIVGVVWSLLQINPTSTVSAGVLGDGRGGSG